MVCWFCIQIFLPVAMSVDAAGHWPDLVGNEHGDYWMFTRWKVIRLFLNILYEYL